MVLTIVYGKVIFVPKESQTKIVKKIVKVVFMGAIVFPKFSGVWQIIINRENWHTKSQGNLKEI